MAAQPELVLASSSPRRAELLTRLGLHFSIHPADIDESLLPGEAPRAHADRLAREKAAVVAARFPGALVVGSDTIVVLDGEILGKPADTDHAVAMLQRLSGREHQVFTGVALVRDTRVRSAVEAVRVRFRTLSPTECAEYAETGEPMDKAGAYGIQGYGSAIVEAVEGDYFAVMGLPVVRLLALLRDAGYRYAFGAGLVEF